MKLAEHVENIRKLIDNSFCNRLGRMGITISGLQPFENIPAEYGIDRKRIESIREVLIEETGTVAAAYEKLIEEFTFTLFNRLAAIKVMEAHTLYPEIITRRSQHGNRSFAHKHWLEQYPAGRNEEMEGIILFLENQFDFLSLEIPFFSLNHPYHLLPTAIELNGIFEAFNEIEVDEQVEAEIWKSDDVLGWLYESYNNLKKAIHKESGEKTEYNKVSIQSQVYTPRWVVKFLVDNSLGKLYLEMYPDSNIRNLYRIANVSNTQTRIPKPLTEIKLIDPATGSGNFLLYSFDLFYDLYTDQISNYGADFEDKKIPELIIAHNLHGIDLDDRAVQIAQLGLFIKAKRRKRSVKIEHFNIVSSDFFLPVYDKVKHLFENGKPLESDIEGIVIDLWADLQQAYKFGSLIRFEEKFQAHINELERRINTDRLGLFVDEEQAKYGDFRENYFINLQNAVAQNTAKQGITFLNTKTQDAITFLQLLTKKYDIAVANPPYTDSADFGPELKRFVETNYKQPHKFNINLYAVFIKRCCEITNNKGYVALIHPHTFMFIKTFEDVRKFIIEHTHIDILVDYGLDRVNLFGPGILLDATWYVLSKQKKDSDGLYFNITTNQQEKAKQSSLNNAYNDAICKRKNDRVYSLTQSKLKMIEGWPFIYWISDAFRGKFSGDRLDDNIKVCSGLSTANNDRFLRYWWEVGKENISVDYQVDQKKWVMYCKGGPYKKWAGNLWVVVNYSRNGVLLKENGGTLRNKDFYFLEGITCSGRSSSKGVSYRYFPPNHIFDVGATGLIPIEGNNLWYGLALMNSELTIYMLDCLNPTVNTTEGDLQKLPFVKPKRSIENVSISLAKENFNLLHNLDTYCAIETEYDKNPLLAFSEIRLRDRLLAYLNLENVKITQVLLNEAVIDHMIFKVYDLSEEDRGQVVAKMGKSVGELPVLEEARKSFLTVISLEQEIVKKHVSELPAISLATQQIQLIQSEFPTLYQSNNNLEEFCKRHQINPINVWFWFKDSQLLPQARATAITLDFLIDSFRNILMEDEDGIISLVGLPGEPKLIDRLEKYCYSKGFNSAQFLQLDGLIGRPINEYIEHYFFKNFSDYLNLFMHLPRTPFIWHLSSGEHQGFEVFIIIYKWNRDSLYKLKSYYITKREESLRNRLMQIGESSTAQAQQERETIRLQLQEIFDFTKKLDELIAESYDPKLDDGVGKNIAPLQKKGMLKYEVLNKKQLEKYLNADW